MSALFSPFQLRDVSFKNRIAFSPMCQFSATDGIPDTWHLVHLGARAVGGAGLIMTESTAVEPIGRISPRDTGIWNDAQVDAWARITDFIHEQGALAGIQIKHAGRKASVTPPWDGRYLIPEDEGGWLPVAPSPVAAQPDAPAPGELTVDQIARTVQAFAEAAARAERAGFDVVEIHAAHGYLLHEFLSPLANFRTDEYGGDLSSRMRFPLEIIEATRATLPSGRPLFVRISATDWVDGGWDLDQSVTFASLARERGVDLIDCSSGGVSAEQSITVSPGYQVPFAAAIRERVGIATGAVGLLDDPFDAEAVVTDGKADLVLIGRELFRDPNWPLRAAVRLGVNVAPPRQYARAPYPTGDAEQAPFRTSTLRDRRASKQPATAGGR